jgi:hypothetical protein
MRHTMLLPIAAAALCLAPLPAAAQSAGRVVDTDRKAPSAADRNSAASRESRERSERERRERSERERSERERANRERRERADRERHERSERERREPQAPRNLPPAERRQTQPPGHVEPPERRQAQPSRHNEPSERHQTQRRQPSAPSASREREAARPGPYSLPSESVVQPAPVTTRVSCSAHPQCASASNYGNACRSVQSTYSGSYALDEGMRSIVSRCRAANSSDTCCAQQCASAATCRSLGAR